MDELLLAYLCEDDDQGKDNVKVVKSLFLESLTVEERRLRYNRIPRTLLDLKREANEFLFFRCSFASVIYVRLW